MRSPRAARRAARPSGPDAAAAPDSSFGYRRFRRMSAVPTAEDRIQQVTIGRQQVRVAIRPGSAECTPLVIANGIGASLELLQPFVDALNPVIEVIRFDVPGSRGAPRPPPIRTPWPAWPRWLGAALTSLGYRHVDILGISWGGELSRQQFAVRISAALPAACPGQHRNGHADDPRRSSRALATLLTQPHYRDPDFAAAVAGNLYGGSLRTDPRPSAGDPPAPGAAEQRHWVRVSAAGRGRGRACPCCPSFASAA